MLKALWRWLWPNDGSTTHERHRADVVTRDQLNDALEKHREALEWEWTEMYEKFNKLHLRLAKRDKRTADRQLDLTQEDEPRPSVLHLRRLGSV